MTVAKHILFRYGSVRLILGFVALLIIPVASATNYSAYPGSAVIVKAVSGQMTGPTQSQVLTLISGGVLSVPLLGGVAIPSGTARYACPLVSSIVTIDNRRGVKINSSNMIVGFTGTILNGVAHYIPQGTEERLRISGGLSFDAFGFATAVGDVEQNYANRLCATITLSAGTQISTVGNPVWGNQFADLDLTMWIYVPLNITPGQYTVTEMGISQGGSSSPNYTGYFPIIENTDTIEVLPPPCTISTETSIVFGTTTEAGMKVSAPVTFQCEQLSVPSALQAFLQVLPISATTSSTELNMTIEGSQPGGVVRGYAGQDLDISQVNCQDNGHSLSFNQAFGPALGPVTSNNNQVLPLIWQLCRKGNEVPGVATGSAMLIVNYK